MWAAATAASEGFGDARGIDRRALAEIERFDLDTHALRHFGQRRKLDGVLGKLAEGRARERFERRRDGSGQTVLPRQAIRIGVEQLDHLGDDPFRALHGRAVGQIDVNEKCALILFRDETGGQAHHQPGDDGGQMIMEFWGHHT